MNLRSFLGLILIIFVNTDSFGLSPARENKEVSAENLKKCIGYLRKECSDKGLRDCATSAKGKRDQVAECIGVVQGQYLNLSEADIKKSFNAKIAEDLLSAQSKNQDEMKCFEIYKKVCGTQEKEACLRENSNAFPSYCGQDVFTTMDSLADEGQSSQCVQDLTKTCTLNLPQVKAGKAPSDEENRRAMQAYQQCLQEQVSQVGNCKNETENMKADNVQFIR